MQLFSRKAWLASFAALVTISPLVAFAQDAAPSDDALDGKLNTYIECYNSLDGRAHKSIERYTSWVKDMKVGPTGTEKVVYGLYQIDTNGIAECKGQFTEAQGLKPSLGLDAVGTEYITALEKLTQVVDEIHPYYDREDYKDDKFAKGKVLHGKFAAQMALFQAASKRFSEELDVENDKRLEAEMVQTEKVQGRKLPYLNMATMHTAKLLMRVLEKEGASNEDIAARLTAFEKAADEEIQFAKANPQGLPTIWSIFVSNIEDFRKAGKERMRRIRDKTPYDQGETMMINAHSGWMVAGSTDKVIKAYNELIERSNSLNN